MNTNNRIAENRKKYYLSRKLLDLRTQILPTRASPTDGSRRPMWIDEIEDDPVIHETLAKNLEAALREIEKAAAACSRKWALKFIDKARHNEFHWCDDDAVARDAEPQELDRRAVTSVYTVIAAWRHSNPTIGADEPTMALAAPPPSQSKAVASNVQVLTTRSIFTDPRSTI
ncbi:hypothetical protein PGTUg99_035438 [Puccinia graminis f. sp. tritici]|uniref:Uncharacterized protein n=1 Tax=Puccinia graminis f. sp. tritici TaxID=56615 RepID=A0A5B0SFH9_PUCGR|nr:hypothetical protein PGTUg99_035438 [Puccinia graminis f. sp. tritici]